MSIVKQRLEKSGLPIRFKRAKPLDNEMQMTITFYFPPRLSVTAHISENYDSVSGAHLEQSVFPHLENGGFEGSVEKGADFALQVFDQSSARQSERVQIDQNPSVGTRQHVRHGLRT